MPATRKKSPAKKSAGRKKTTGAHNKKTTGHKKAATRKYSHAAGENVHEELHEMKRGELTSGRSGKKVTSRKQAIAIGLSEARRGGKKVPPNPKRKDD
ncbi:MAG TPA: DUF6496 domain-containing protein [Candidatus Baltobacteraceae bacterium]|nr:DUF6496 domain-containing protein [Candidatus Baltobacteraceae bacterium]